jgi:hypothetical protein
LSFEVGDFV